MKLTCQKLFIKLLFLSALVWSVVPLLRKSLPMDTQEAIIWGKYCLWGTTKHPPLSGWVSYGFYKLFGSLDFSMYLLSQICVLLGLWGIYKLAKCFLTEQNALLATAFQLGIIFYHFSATEFNVNVLSLAIWPWCTYCFWCALQNNKLKHWLLFGLLMGINILNKYVGGILGIALGAFVLLTPKARSIFKNPKAYLSVLVCLFVCLPHILWLYETDFGVLSYISERNPTGKITSFWRHLFYPVKFLLAQILFVLPAVISFWLVGRKQEKKTIPSDIQNRNFLLCIGFVPTLFWVLKSALWGSPLKDMWNFPCLFALGILAFYFIPHEWAEQKAKRFIKTMFVWSMLFAVGYGVQCAATTSLRFQSDCKQVVKELVDNYNAEHQKKLRYVGGNIWFSDMVSLYAKDEIKPVIWMNTKANPWFDETDILHSNVLVVVEKENEYNMYAAKFKNKLTQPKQKDIIYKNRFGKKKIQPMYWGVYQGENDNEK